MYILIHIFFFSEIPQCQKCTMKKNSTKRCRNCVIHLRGFIPQNKYNLRRQSSRRPKSKTLENIQPIPLENNSREQKSKTLDVKNESEIENNTKDEEIGNTNLYYTNDLFTVNDFDTFLSSFE